MDTSLGQGDGIGSGSGGGGVRQLKPEAGKVAGIEAAGLSE